MDTRKVRAPEPKSAQVRAPESGSNCCALTRNAGVNGAEQAASLGSGGTTELRDLHGPGNVEAEKGKPYDENVASGRADPKGDFGDGGDCATGAGAKVYI
jgi:hypothetical protein